MLFSYMDSISCCWILPKSSELYGDEIMAVCAGRFYFNLTLSYTILALIVMKLRVMDCGLASFKQVPLKMLQKIKINKINALVDRALR